MNTYKGIQYKRINNDINGNPRYIIHYLDFLDKSELYSEKDYTTAKNRANSIGGKVYRGSDFGGGFVFQSYNIENTIEKILDSIAEDIGYTIKHLATKVRQLNMQDAFNQRVCFEKRGWTDVKIQSEELEKASIEIAELIGGWESTKKSISFVLRNQPVYEWFTNRFVYDLNRECWTYVAGQDYREEIKQIRRKLKK